MIILRPLLLLTNLHLKLLSTQGTGADKLLSTQRVKRYSFFLGKKLTVISGSTVFYLSVTDSRASGCPFNDLGLMQGQQ